MTACKRMLVTAVVLVVVMATAGGCKTVQTTFVNTTSEALELQVNGPGNNVGYLGTIPGDGQLRTKIEVSPVWLPTTYTFTAKSATNKEYTGAFSLANDSNDKIQVMIPQDDTALTPDWRHAEGSGQTGGHTPITYEP
ncbi:MAG: hypothetical protein JW849_03645 [Phycisphaerae bacterium]|nr:hypothetical protein [Phycisphaerae bacterium]